MNRPVDPPDDLLLVMRVLNSETEALESFAQRMRCIPRILSALNVRRGRLLSDEDVADLAQDTFLIVWRKLEIFDGRIPLEGWVYQVCKLELSNRLRKQRRRAKIFEQVAHSARIQSEPTAEGLADDLGEELQRGLDTLDPDEQSVLRMRHFENLTLDEVAERLGDPPSTARTRYYRGIKKLQAFFANRSDLRP